MGEVLNFAQSFFKAYILIFPQVVLEFEYLIFQTL